MHPLKPSGWETGVAGLSLRAPLRGEMSWRSIGLSGGSLGRFPSTDGKTSDMTFAANTKFMSIHCKAIPAPVASNQGAGGRLGESIHKFYGEYSWPKEAIQSTPSVSLEDE